MKELCWLWGQLLFNIAAFYIFGTAILYIFGIRLKRYLNFFVSLLTASVVLTTVFAVYMTKGKTVFSLLALCLLVFVLQRLLTKALWQDLKKSYSHIHIFSFGTKKEFKVQGLLQNSLVFLLISLCCYLPNALMLIKLNGKFPYYIPPQDLVGYSNFVKQLLITQQENYNGLTTNLIDDYFHGLSPYHFYEFWLAAFLVKCTSILPLFAYWLWVYPLFYLTTWAGVLAVWEYFQAKITWKKQLFSLLLLFLGGIYLPFYKYLPYLDSTVYLHNNTLLTYGLLEPFLLVIYLLWQSQRKELAVLVLLCIPLLSITTLAGVVGAIIGIAWWSYEHQNRQFAYKSLGALGLLLIGLLLLYGIWGTKNEAAFSWREFTPIVSTQLYDFPQNIFWVIKQIAVVFGLYLFKSIWVYAPYIVVLFCSYSSFGFQIAKKNLVVIKYFVFVPICGLSGMWLVVLHHDASQVFRNLFFPLLNVVLVLQVIYYYTNFYAKKLISKQLTTLAVSLIIFYQIIYSAYHKYQQVAERQEYSEDYLLAVQSALQKLPENSVGAFIYPPSFYKDDLFSKVIRHQLPAGYLTLFPNIVGIINIGIFEIPYSQKYLYRLQEERLRKNSEFYQFVQARRKIDNVRSSKDLQNEFIHQYTIQFILVGKNASIDTISCENCVKVLEDTLYGEKLLLRRLK